MEIEELPGVDLQQALDRVVGNWSLLRKVLSRYHEQSANFFQSINQKIAEGDWEAATREAHTLKGSSATIGALEVSAVASDLEGLLRNIENTPETERAALLKDPIREVMIKLKVVLDGIIALDLQQG